MQAASATRRRRVRPAVESGGTPSPEAFIIRRLHAAVLIAATSAASTALGAAGGLAAVATDSVYYGLSRTQGDPAVLLDGHLRTDRNLFVGVTVATVKVNPGPSAPLELGAYLGRSFDLGADWTVRATLAHAAYPAKPNVFPYDYTEGIVSLAWRELVIGTLSYSPDTSRYSSYGVNRHRPAEAAEIALHREIRPWCVLSAGVGYRRLAAPIAAGYAYGSAALAVMHRSWQADLALIGTDASARDLFGNAVAGPRVVLGVLWRFGADAPRN